LALDTSPLFRPLKVKGKVLRNRIVMPPMVTNRMLVSPDAAEWYGRRARGGAAMVIVQATPVGRFGYDLSAENLRPLVSAIHAGGALAGIQLSCTGRDDVVPDDLSSADIDVLVQRYRMAAGLCAAAGFDAIEPHGAHDTLLNQFFSPEMNRRTDAYGGSDERRMRLALDIIIAIRPACGASMLVMYRHSPVGAGYGIEDSVAFAERLVGAGVDILDLSPSSERQPGDRSEPFRELGAAVITVNGMDRPERSLEALTQRRAHLVAVGRGMIADPDWPIKVRQGRLDEIVTCDRCDGCLADLREGRPVTCRRWPSNGA